MPSGYELSDANNTLYRSNKPTINDMELQYSVHGLLNRCLGGIIL